MCLMNCCSQSVVVFILAIAMWGGDISTGDNTELDLGSESVFLIYMMTLIHLFYDKLVLSIHFNIFFFLFGISG